MKEDTNTHNLGSDFRQGSQNWYYLIVPDNGLWRVEMEKDYDDPTKKGYTMPVPRDEISKHSLDGVPLTELISKKLAELGKSSD